MLDAMLSFIDTVLPSQRFVLAGYSYGGYLAHGVASRRAALIDGLMLMKNKVVDSQNKVADYKNKVVD